VADIEGVLLREDGEESNLPREKFYRYNRRFSFALCIQITTSLALLIIGLNKNTIYKFTRLPGVFLSLIVV
jgi:hypothetical protein